MNPLNNAFAVLFWHAASIGVFLLPLRLLQHGESCQPLLLQSYEGSVRIFWQQRVCLMLAFIAFVAASGTLEAISLDLASVKIFAPGHVKLMLR